MRMTLHLAAAAGLPGLRPARRARRGCGRGATTYAAARRGARRARPRALVRDAADEPGDPRAGPRLRRRAAGPEHAGARRPHAAAARPAPARRPLARHDPQLALRARPAPAARRPTTPPRSSSPATSRRSAPPAERDVAGLGGRRPARLPVASAPDRHLPRRAGHRAARPPGRPLPPARHAAPAALPRQLGPAAARLRRPRPDHPARGPAAEAHAQRRATVTSTAASPRAGHGRAA